MSIQNAHDAEVLTASTMTVESVLTEIEFAARHGQRSWVFAWMPLELQGELQNRGFRLDDLGSDYVVVEW